MDIPFCHKARMWQVLPPLAKINTSILYPSWKLGWSNMISHPPVCDFLAKKINFQEGIQDRSIYFRHRWRWSKSGLGECPIWNYPILTVIGISPFFKFQSQRERQFQSPAGSAFGNSIGDDRVGGAEHCFRISQRKNVDGKTLGYFHHFVPLCCKLRLGHMTTFLC